MIDLTITVMLPPRGHSNFGKSAHPKWRVLDIISTHEYIRGDEAIGAQRTGVIHVMGCPFHSHEEANVVLTLPLVSTVEVDPVFEKRRYVGTHTLLTDQQRTELLSQRKTTMTWTEFERIYRHVESGRGLGEG